MLELLSFVGVFLAIEGALYAGAPNFARRMALRILEMDDQSLRRAGLFSLAAGVFLVWLVRG
ncbi:MAG: DUF2065 domain-containing protein [Pseudomonadota bacterium]